MIRSSSSVLLGVISIWMFSLLSGCAETSKPVAPSAPSNPGTTATIQFPEAADPILTRQLADRIQTGMAQETVMAILVDAAKDEPSAKGMIEPLAAQSKLNSLRYDLTVEQGKRKLILEFRSNALVDKKQEMPE